MRDKFENFINELTAKTKTEAIKWEEHEREGVYKLSLENTNVILSFHITLMKKPKNKIKFEVFNKENKTIISISQNIEDRYYNRLHSLCRIVRGEYMTLDDVVDMLSKDLGIE